MEYGKLYTLEPLFPDQPRNQVEVVLKEGQSFVRSDFFFPLEVASVIILIVPPLSSTSSVHFHATCC